MDFKCLICGKACEGFGNSPSPIKEEGLCCDDCNRNFVVPKRIRLLEQQKYVIFSKEAEVCSTDKIDLHMLQIAVDGHIEPIQIPPFIDRDIVMIVNEEGKIRDMRPSFAVTRDNRLTDLLVGNIVFCISGRG